MITTNEKGHFDHIICPDCKKEQMAFVLHTIPFNTYIHECTNCNYLIMESEWNINFKKMETDLANNIELKELELREETLKNFKLSQELKKMEKDFIYSNEKIEKLKYQIEKLKEFTK